HALPYQGSKRQLAHAIVPLLPADTARVIEPFAGSAAISLAARYVGVGRAALISDVNVPLMRLWREILDDPTALALRYQRLWFEQRPDPHAFFAAVRSTFNASHEPHHLLYLLARCVKAAVRYNRDGEFNQGADHRRLGARPDVMRARLTATSAALAGAHLEAVDYAAVLRGADRADVVYLDPPYQGVSTSRDRRYVVGLPRDAFVAELATAVDRETSFLVSYDGRSGTRAYGVPLPPELGLLHLHLHAGTSSQATLNGMSARTVESLYLSPALVRRDGGAAAIVRRLTGTPAR
ncbi:MAG TPA: DNA adenine methylase, partial [Micromonosporaceae bacterium]